MRSVFMMLAAAVLGVCVADSMADVPIEALSADDECITDGGGGCAVNALQHAARVTSLVEDDFGTASVCVPGKGCSRNDVCQKLGNNGGKPITGTLSCKSCVGSRKCQVFGVGNAFTCGCTVGAMLAEEEASVEQEEAMLDEPSDSDASLVETEEDFGTASVCVPGTGCSRNDVCQKLGNNGGKPITGTVNCKRCAGSRKCQVFGRGTAFTCGCTV